MDYESKGKCMEYREDTFIHMDQYLYLKVSLNRIQSKYVQQHYFVKHKHTLHKAIWIWALEKFSYSKCSEKWIFLSF